MPRLVTSKIEAAFEPSQDSYGCDFFQLKGEDAFDLALLLSNLDELNLEILLVVSQFDGIGTTAVAQTIHLSRYAVLIRTKKLEKWGLLLRDLIPSRIKGAYSLHLGSGLCREIIEIALRKKKGACMSNNFDSQEQPSNQSPKDIHALRFLIQQLNPPTLTTLRLIAHEGKVTVRDLIDLYPERKKPHVSTVHKRLEKLMNFSLVARQKLSSNGKEYLFCLAPNVTAELIEAACRKFNANSDADCNDQAEFNYNQGDKTINTKYNSTPDLEREIVNESKNDSNTSKDSDTSNSHSIPIHDVLKAILQRLADLEKLIDSLNVLSLIDMRDRFDRLEQDVKGLVEVDSEEIKELLIR